MYIASRAESLSSAAEPEVSCFSSSPPYSVTSFSIMCCGTSRPGVGQKRILAPNLARAKISECTVRPYFKSPHRAIFSPLMVCLAFLMV